jgi:hypothetical protein
MMRIKRFKNSGLFAVVICLTSSIQAQTSVNASGGDASGSGGTVSYSVGQTAYTTHSGSGGSIAQGVQHAYIISPVGINETDFESSLRVFPNPTTDILLLEIHSDNFGTLRYELLDLQGKVLIRGDVLEQHTTIDMSVFPAASYLLYVVNEQNKQIQSFKIIKH